MVEFRTPYGRQEIIPVRLDKMIVKEGIGQDERENHAIGQQALPLYPMW